MSKHEFLDVSVDWRRRVLDAVEECAAIYGVSLAEVLAKHGPRHVGEARKAAVVHAKRVTGYSVRSIAEVIGKDPKIVTRAMREAREAAATTKKSKKRMSSRDQVRRGTAR